MTSHDFIVAHSGQQTLSATQLIVDYLQDVYGISGQFPSAPLDYWNNTPPQLADFTKTHGNNVVLGDIVVWAAGYISIATGQQDSDSIEVLASDVIIDYRRIVRSSIVGILRPYPLLPTPTPEPTEPMIYIENTVDGIYYRSNGNPVKMYVVRREGTDQQEFADNIKTGRDFIGVPNTHKNYGDEVRIMATAHHPLPPTGYDFYLDMDAFGQFTKTGKVARTQGYPLKDLGTVKPPPKVARATPVAEILPPPPVVRELKPLTAVEPKTPPDTKSWNFRYLREDHQPVRFKVMQRVVIQDYLQKGAKVELGQGKTIAIYGTFNPGSGLRLMPKLADAVIFDYWYGIPELDSMGLRIVEELPDYTDLRETTTTIPERKVLKTASFTDHVIDFLSKHEARLYNRIKAIRK
jgi:hypothetical protein